MNLSNPGIIYILLVIPTLFAVSVIGQGIYKVSHGDTGGKLGIGFGAVFLACIIAAYVLYIR